MSDARLLDALVRKHYDKATEVLNPGAAPEGMSGTRALALMNEFLAKADDGYSLEEMIYALYGGAVIAAAAMEEISGPSPSIGSPNGMSLDDFASLLRSMEDDDLLRVWFEIGEQEPWDQSERLIRIATDEFKRLGMPVVPRTGIS